MEDYKAMATPMNLKESLSKEDDIDKVEEGYFRSMIGCLMYLTTTRPNILFAISILSHYMYCASVMHLKDAKRVIRYIKGTIDFGVNSRIVKTSSCWDFLTVIWVDQWMT